MSYLFPMDFLATFCFFTGAPSASRSASFTSNKTYLSSMLLQLIVLRPQHTFAFLVKCGRTTYDLFICGFIKLRGGAVLG